MQYCYMIPFASWSVARWNHSSCCSRFTEGIVTWEKYDVKEEARENNGFISILNSFIKKIVPKIITKDAKETRREL